MEARERLKRLWVEYQVGRFNADCGGVGVMGFFGFFDLIESLVHLMILWGFFLKGLLLLRLIVVFLVILI
jgi:hypothetical protein